MLTKGNIEINGRVAEIIDNESNRYIRIVCESNNMMIELNDIEDISLGDRISIGGKLSVESVTVNGIELESYKL